VRRVRVLDGGEDLRLRGLVDVVVVLLRREVREDLSEVRVLVEVVRALADDDLEAFAGLFFVASGVGRDSSNERPLDARHSSTRAEGSPGAWGLPRRASRWRPSLAFVPALGASARL